MTDQDTQKRSNGRRTTTPLFRRWFWLGAVVTSLMFIVAVYFAFDLEGNYPDWYEDFVVALGVTNVVVNCLAICFCVQLGAWTRMIVVAIIFVPTIPFHLGMTFSIVTF